MTEDRGPPPLAASEVAARDQPTVTVALVAAGALGSSLAGLVPRVRSAFGAKQVLLVCPASVAGSVQLPPGVELIAVADESADLAALRRAGLAAASGDVVRFLHVDRDLAAESEAAWSDRLRAAGVARPAPGGGAR